MEYVRKSNVHSIKMDDNEISLLVNALNSCNLIERREFNKLVKYIKDGKDLLNNEN